MDAAAAAGAATEAARAESAPTEAAAAGVAATSAPSERRRPWKWLGLAGLTAIVATGAAIARSERKRAAYTPDQVRERLHARHAEATRTL